MKKSQQPIQRPISQYIGKQHTILDETLAHVPGTLPQPYSKLQCNLKNIPHHMMNDNIHKQIHKFNKSLILVQFQFICQLVVKIYQNSIENKKFEQDKFLQQVKKQLYQNLHKNSYLCKMLSESLQSSKNKQPQLVTLKTILQTLGQAHNKIYEYNIKQKPTLSFNNLLIKTDKNKVPQKYTSFINYKITEITNPIKRNYFQDLIWNNVTNLRPAQIWENQLQAETNACFLNQLFKQKYKIQANQWNKDKIFKPTNSLITFIPSKANQSQQQLTQSKQNKQLQHIDQIQKQQKIQLQNWFTNTLSQMTFYQSYMMAHMADLILLHPQQFQPKFIKYQPYFNQLKKHLQQQLNHIKSQQTIFSILYKSKYTKQSSLTNLLIQNVAKQRIKKQMKPKLFNKAIGVIQGLYHKASQQLNKKQIVNKNMKVKQEQKQSQVNMIDYMKVVEQHQNVVIPHNLDKISKQFHYNLIGLQNLSLYIKNIYETQNRSTQSMLDSIKKFAIQIKRRFVDDQHQYHSIQSWMSIVIILYKQIAFDISNNYHYTPLKRRTIIKICKNIFRQQSAIGKYKKNNKKKSEENPFKNWSVVLRFLQNNRPQILNDSQGVTNQKAVDSILQQLYEAIAQKKIRGSSFDNLFEGIQNVKQNLPQIKLICLSNGSSPKQNLNKTKTNTQCKVVHILISGFLSENTNKLQQWSDMVDMMSDSQIYALVWESNTIKNLVKFFLRSAVDVIGAIKIMDQLRKKYTDNPFNPAFQVAQITGRILAEFVIRLFPNRFVNVCGYSLGTQVIKQFVNRMINKKHCNLINNIYLIGGVSDVSRLTQIITKSEIPLSITNCFTNNDSVLRHLLSLCKPDIKPIGLNQIQKIEGHNILNLNCTKFISGHLAFRNNLNIMGQILELSTG